LSNIWQFCARKKTHFEDTCVWDSLDSCYLFFRYSISSQWKNSNWQVLCQGMGMRSHLIIIQNSYQYELYIEMTDWKLWMLWWHIVKVGNRYSSSIALSIVTTTVSSACKVQVTVSPAVISSSVVTAIVCSIVAPSIDAVSLLIIISSTGFYHYWCIHCYSPKSRNSMNHGLQVLALISL